MELLISKKTSSLYKYLEFMYYPLKVHKQGVAIIIDRGQRIKEDLTQPVGVGRTYSKNDVLGLSSKEKLKKREKMLTM